MKVYNKDLRCRQYDDHKFGEPFSDTQTQSYLRDQLAKQKDVILTQQLRPLQQELDQAKQLSEERKVMGEELEQQKQQLQQDIEVITAEKDRIEQNSADQLEDIKTLKMLSLGQISSFYVSFDRF